MTAAALIAVAAAAALLMRALSPTGAIAAWAVATALYLSAGWQALVLLGALFLLATTATRLGTANKRSLGIEEAAAGRRGAVKVVANSAVGLCFALLGMATLPVATCAVAMAAAFGTAACDTVSSEIGKAYGRRTYLVTTMDRVPAGRAGGVTLAGTFSGALAGLLIALIAWMLDLVEVRGMLIVTAAAFAGAMIESCLRATILSGRALGSIANLINTTMGALIALGLYALAG
jgi:uncharacterized protein (TIGR00297 family)